MNNIRSLYTLLLTLSASVCICSGAWAQSISPGTLTQVPAPSGTGFSLYTPGNYRSDTTINYVRTWVAQQPYTTEAALLNAGSTAGYHQTTQYYDGLDRLVESVQWQMSSQGNDLVASNVYDSIGRETYQFLPYEAPTNSGTFQPNTFSDQSTFYSSTYPTDFPALKGEQVYYGHALIEASPLNRTLQVTARGNSWTGSGVGTVTGYFASDTTDKVPVWTIAFNPPADANNIPRTSAIYAPGTLSKTITVDERGSQVVEYKDLEGQVVEKRVQVANAVVGSGLGAGWLVTQYVYDDLNQLRVVIPPKAVDLINTASDSVSLSVLDGLCFRYEYDYRKRIIAKKVPGAGWNWMVYDQRNRIVFSQDGNQATKNWWLTTLYDGLDRPIMTGMTTYAGTQSQLQQHVDSMTTSPGASIRTDSVHSVSGVVPNLTVSTRQIGDTAYHASSTISFTGTYLSEPNATFVASIVPAGGSSSSVSTTTVIGNPLPSGATFIPLTEHFYDDYTWGTVKKYATNHNSQLDIGSNVYGDSLPAIACALTRGMPTGSRIRVLEDSVNLSLGGWLETASFYDQKGRVVQTQGDNYKGGEDTLTQRYDFTAKVVSSYLSHSNLQASTAIRIKTNNNYDTRGRLQNIQKTVNDNPVLQRTIATYTYSRLGQMKLDIRGKGSNGTPLDTEAYDYNIRGWLKGINRGFTNSALGITTGGTWFGEDIAYDWGFDSTAINGNISGIVWKSGGNNYARAYGYSYDRANRIMYADFNQEFGSTWAKNDPNGGSNGGPSLNIDFTSRMGDGKTYNTAYDDNGNILAMHQLGLVVNQSQVIDSLNYNYGTNPTNQLQGVSDSVKTNTHLGDFYNGNTSVVDYSYDANGNLKEDLNKGINWISYDHLNLPYALSIQPTTGAKGTITYIYDATGTKLEKRVMETPDSSDGQTTTYSTTDYIGGFVYQNNNLQFFSHEEGRVRPYVNPTGQVRVDTLLYDYFIKDHLGDTRMVLTEEQRRDAYPMASMEIGDSALENNYYANLDSSRKPIAGITTGAYPTDNTTNPNQYVAGLGGLSSTVKIGPSITLRVMARDSIYAKVSSWYDQTSQTVSYNPLPVANLVAALSTSLTGVAATLDGVGTSIPSSGLLQPDASNFLTKEPAIPNVPKAYLNWIVFDDQFRFVSSSSSCQQVQPNSTGVLNYLNAAIQVPVSGYIYIYLSNADSLTTVYFDNLQVTQAHGPLTEEEHYYPFGLTMAGISDEALAFGKYNNYRYNGIEQIGDLGLQDYNAYYRNLDPQIGRWWQIDPQANFDESPYASMQNNPIAKMDWLGNYFSWANGTEDTYKKMRAKSAELVKGYMSELSKLDLNSTDDKVQGQIKELTTLINMQGELNSQWDAMENSSIEYHVSGDMPANGEGGNTQYVSSESRVDINLGKNTGNISIMAHEFRHGYGYLDGEMIAGGDGLYDMSDEVVAYNAGFLFADRQTANLVAKGYYDVNWFKSNMMKLSIYKDLTGKDEPMSLGAKAAEYASTHDDYLSHFININRNNSNIVTVKDAIDAANAFSKDHGQQPKYQYGQMLGNK
jgi:RHS repeat-associated protein